MDKKRIAVIGSINTDFSFMGKRMPQPGETIIGSGFKTNFGGKGANVCVAMSRLGADVTLFGVVGNDLYSVENIKNLRREKVNADSVGVCNDLPGGTAGIFVDDNTNSIFVIPGANGAVTREYLEKNKKELLKNDIFCMQLEVPIETIEYAIDILNRENKVVVFNPSPIHKLSNDIYDKCNYIIVNEVEIKELPGYKSNEQMLTQYGGRLVLTHGADGVYYYNNAVKHIPAYDAGKVVDTTGAGDTFLGAFTVAISDGKNIDDAIVFANKCAGIKTTKLGAQSGMPSITEVNKF